jgi:FGGY family of carbohydrate kinases, C-terminal domain
MSRHGNRLVEAPTNSDQELRLLVEAIPALVWRAGPEGDIEYVNKRVGARLGRLSVDGGATRNDLLMQFQADLLGRPVQRLKVLELSAFGAGLLAAASGLMEEAGIDAMLNSATEEINPRLDPFRTPAENRRFERGSRPSDRQREELSASYLRDVPSAHRSTPAQGGHLPYRYPQEWPHPAPIPPPKSIRFRFPACARNSNQRYRPEPSHQ